MVLFLGRVVGQVVRWLIVFTHITNFVAQRHSVITRGHQFLEPRAYLNIEITDEQCYLLQQTAADVFLGNILEDSLVQNAKKKIPSRHIIFLSGNITSYGQVLNNSKAIQHIEDMNMLSVCLSKISESWQLAKDAAKEKKAQEAKLKEEKKANDQAEFEKKKGELQEELLQDLTIFVATAGTTLKSFTKDKLLNLLKFYFKDKMVGLSSMKCGALIDLVQKKSDEMNSVGTATDFDVDIGNALIRSAKQDDNYGASNIILPCLGN